VLHALIRELGIALARLDGCVTQQFLDRDHLGSLFKKVGGKRMPQTMTAGFDVSGLGIALQLFLNALEL
jgi:hypothetical protein